MKYPELNLKDFLVNQTSQPSGNETGNERLIKIRNSIERALEESDVVMINMQGIRNLSPSVTYISFGLFV